MTVKQPCCSKSLQMLSHQLKNIDISNTPITNKYNNMQLVIYIIECKHNKNNNKNEIK